jgi:glutaconate CoA-transferase subunit A
MDGDMAQSTKTFIEARHDLRSRDRSLRDKRVALPDALESIADGDHVAIGGCLYSRTPLAALMELLRLGRSNLTLSRSLMCYEGEMFLAAGASKHLMTSWMAIGLPWGISRTLRRYVESGKAEFEEWSHLSMGLRYRAGAMGVPFLPTLTMLGSDLHRYGATKEIEDPFTGERVCLVPALFPDIGLVHVHRADRFGNAQIDGYPHMDTDIVKAARRVIVTAEEIVDDDYMKADGARTSFPYYVVDAVVEVPGGSYPHEMYGAYDADFDHFDRYVGLTKKPGGIEQYLEEYVFGVADHAAFLETFPDGAFAAAVQRAGELLR